MAILEQILEMYRCPETSVFLLVFDIAKNFLDMEHTLIVLLRFWALSAPQAKNFTLFGVPLAFSFVFSMILIDFFENVKKFFSYVNFF